MSNQDEIVEIFTTVDAVVQASVAAPADEDAAAKARNAQNATIRKMTGELEELRQANKTRADSIAQEEENIGNLQNLMGPVRRERSIHDAPKKGEEDELPSHGSRGEVLPRGRKYELARRQKNLQALKEASVACTRNIATKEAELEHVRQAAAAPVASDKARALGGIAQKNIGRSARVQAAAEELGKAVREWYAGEQEMAATANTERARRALSLAALQERLAYGLVPSGTFEIPKAAGVREPQVFIQLAGIDPTSPWRKLKLSEICEQHYVQLIAETCRGR